MSRIPVNRMAPVTRTFSVSFAPVVTTTKASSVSLEKVRFKHYTMSILSNLRDQMAS